MQPSDVRGAGRVVTDAIVGITDVVEAMHASIAHLPGTPRPAAPGRARGVSGFAYRSVRAITVGVGRTLDGALSRLAPAFGPTDPSAGREVVVAALNGLLGDYLDETGNPLAIPMRLRRAGQSVDLASDPAGTDAARCGPRVLLRVHGLCLSDLHWRGPGRDPGDALARDLGYTVLDVHYNSGRHISTNGRELADLLQTLVERATVPLESLTIVAHSMGGLVARSACHHAVAASLDWPARLRELVFIATPHHGAPLERTGNWVHRIVGATPYAAPLARLARIRSAGITDLRHGSLVNEDWEGRDRFAADGDLPRVVPLPADVRCYAVAAGNGRSGRRRAVADRLLGDGLVPLDSALGRHAEPHRDLGIPASRQWVAEGVGHLDLATHTDVWAKIRDWLATPDDVAPSRAPPNPHRSPGSPNAPQ